MTQVDRGTEPDIRKMGLVQRSRHLAYEKPTKDAEDAQQKARVRVQNINTLKKEQLNSFPTREELEARKERDHLTGELKSAEARDRVSSLKSRYEECQKIEMDRILLAQPTSLRALRLSVLLEEPLNNSIKLKSRSKLGRENLNEIERIRCETIISDREGLTFERK